MNRKQKALEYFNGNYNCSQSVLTAFGDITGLPYNSSMKIASGFGGGIAKTQKTCGALTGAVMVISWKFFDDNNPIDSKKHVYEKTREFLTSFRKIHKYTNCLDLTGIDFSMENETDKDKSHEEKCKIFISDVCDLLEKIVDNK